MQFRKSAAVTSTSLSEERAVKPSTSPDNHDFRFLYTSRSCPAVCLDKLSAEPNLLFQDIALQFDPGVPGVRTNCPPCRNPVLASRRLLGALIPMNHAKPRRTNCPE